MAGRGNQVAIDITTTDKAGLGALVAKYRKGGQQLGDAIADGFRTAEQKTTQSQNKMSTAMRGTVSQMTRELDKLERSAALSGEGMSDGYRDALGKVRGDLEQLTDVAKRTGRGFDDGMSGSLRSVQRSIDELKPAVQEVDRAFDRAGKSAEHDLDAIEQAAHKAGRSMDADFQKALKGLRDDLQKARTEGARTGATLESELGGALSNVRQEAEKLRQSLKPQGGGDGGGLLEDLIGEVPLAKGGALAAGAAVGAALWSGLQGSWERRNLGGLIAAQSGAAKSEAGRLGNVAGSIFSKGFGESLEQVGEAMSAVFSNKLLDTGAAEGSIERVTKKVITLQQTTGESANDIARSTRQLLVTGLAQNMTAAMDMIQTATEHGLNSTDELLDTIEEYSTQFRNLGLNGQQAFGLIEQAMEGGARNVDVAADALKEFQIRAQDGSVATRNGFKMIGLDADVMGKKIAAGGTSAKDALQQTLNKLSAMEPGVERNTAAVALFGTKAEDLGNALYDMDLDTAADKFGKFGGSVEAALQKLSNVSGAEKFDRAMSNAKANVGNFLDSLGSSDAMDEIQGKFALLKQAMEEFLATGDSSSLDALKEKFPELAEGIDAFVKANGGAKESMDDASASAKDYEGNLQSLIDAKRELAGEVLSLRDAERGWQEAIDDAAQAIKDNGKTLDLNTEKGRNNQEALDDLADQALDTADAMTKNGKSVKDVNGFLERAGDEFIRTGTKMGMAKGEAVRLAIQLGLIPNNVSTRMQLLGMSYAQARAEQFRNLIYSIPSTKYVSLRVSAQGSGHYFAEQESGGITGHRPMLTAATGGARNGPTMVNEAGPEIASLPNGSKVATAGATQAMLDSGLITLGEGGGSSTAPRVVELRAGDDLTRVMLKNIREAVRDQGGNVQFVLGANR